MQIRTADGSTENVASSGSVNTALTLGAIGLGLGVLNGGNGNGMFGGLFGGNNQTKYVTKDEFDMGMKLAEKDSTIALLQSEKTTDAKLVDVFKEAAQRDRDIRDLIALNKAEQAAINANQMAYNATANSSISVLQSQVAALSGVTKMYIPSNNICQQSCCGCNAQ